VAAIERTPFGVRFDGANVGAGGATGATDAAGAVWAGFAAGGAAEAAGVAGACAIAMLTFTQNSTAALDSTCRK